ncbi:MAG TPA: hypothetical protein VJ508_02360, partial [Saprospiraceae bacterium]|nr:hypothetical protein [Saprospiraceae bacterium]
YCLLHKWEINYQAKENFTAQGISHDRYFTTPAPLQNWLWFVVAGDNNGYHVGYTSIYDRNKHIQFEYFPRNDSLLNPVRNQENVQRLIRFSQQYYTAEKWHDTLVFNDLRFGQMLGWEQPRQHFAFHYFLDYPDQNALVVQRGRFYGWNWTVVHHFWKRIRGN